MAAAAAAKARVVEVEKEKVEGDDERPIEGAAILSLLLLKLELWAARQASGLALKAREDTDARRGSEPRRIQRI